MEAEEGTVAILEVEAEGSVAVEVVGVEVTVSSVGSLVIGLGNAHLVEETVGEVVATILLMIVMVVTLQVIEMVEAATAVETMEVVTAIVIAIVEVIAGMEVVMGKKGSQTIVKGMVAAAVVVVTDTMVAVTVIQVLETALALMTAPVNAPVGVAVLLMMNVIENILPQEMTHISCI
jgi:hypothetical protein